MNRYARRAAKKQSQKKWTFAQSFQAFARDVRPDAFTDVMERMIKKTPLEKRTVPLRGCWANWKKVAYQHLLSHGWPPALTDEFLEVEARYRQHFGDLAGDEDLLRSPLLMFPTEAGWFDFVLTGVAEPTPGKHFYH